MLVPRNDSTFTTDVLPGPFIFRRLADGRSGLYAPGLGMDVPAVPLRPTPVLTSAERQGIVGCYASDELLSTFVVREQEGQLQIRGGWGAMKRHGTVPAGRVLDRGQKAHAGTRSGRTRDRDASRCRSKPRNQAVTDSVAAPAAFPRDKVRLTSASAACSAW